MSLSELVKQLSIFQQAVGNVEVYETPISLLEDEAKNPIVGIVVSVNDVGELELQILTQN